MADHPTLEETIALLEAALEATYDGIIVVDLNRRVVLYNRQYLRMFGFTAEEVERGGVDWIISTVESQLENVEALAETSRRLWEHPEREVLDTLRFHDGRVFSRFVAPHRVGGRVVGLVASLRDVSNAVRTEEALEQHRTFLEKAQEVAHIGSWVAELDGSRRLGWSAETHRIFGITPEQFDGTVDFFRSLVHPDDREMLRAAAVAAEEGRAPYSIDHRIIVPDKKVRWVHEQADVVRDAQGRAVRMIGTVQDITERRQLEEQLLQSQKMEAIGRLAGGIAHDLNNALTAIAGYAELALSQLTADHPARADVEEIRRATERAGSVTRQLLAFSRKQFIEPRVFNLNDTVSSLGRLLARLLGAHIEVRTQVGSDLPRVIGDPGQIEQAIVNLAVNARDAMPTGGQLILETSAEEVGEAFARTHVPMTPGRYAVLRVTDTGQGMTSDTQRRIFEPFFTTKEIGKGTGLGLSMVYGTVKQTGGFIFVDTGVGRGTTFSLFFPAAESGAQNVSPDKVEPAPAVRGGETLLVAEDEAAVRNLVASSLRNAGYRLLLAESADEALAIAAAHDGPIDLLLTDATMPGRSGIDLARTLTAKRPHMPVIVMSGYTEESLPFGSVEQSFSLLQKPFTPRELRQRIRDVLDR